MKITADVVAGLVGSMFAPRFDGAVATPECHKEWWELCCSDAQYVAIAAPRRHAKTTAITVGYGLACLLFRERRFYVIVSDTETQAAMFLGSIKNELTDNRDVIELFGLKLDDKGEVEFIKDTATDIIVACTDGHTFRIMAKGAEQKLRGMNWNGRRPDLIICDDLENDELVMNPDRRRKVKNWFTAALIPSMAKHGIIRVVGTILHMDSLLENLMPEEQTRVIRRGPTNKRVYIESDELKSWSTVRTGWRSVRYRAHNPDFSALLWPENYTQQYFEDLYNMFAAQGNTDLYSQEYLNRPLDEANTYFKREDFKPLPNDFKKRKLNYYITADLAISQDTSADYSVFLVAGMDDNRVLHVTNVIRERLDAREIVDTLIALQRQYDPIVIGIEEMQISKSIGPFLNEEMMRSNTFINLQKLKHNNKDKVWRARSIQARMRAGGCRFDKQADWYDIFEEECLQFPRGKHDDMVDAFAYLGLMLDKLIEAPTNEEIEEEEYLEEFGEYIEEHEGRSSYTGY